MSKLLKDVFKKKRAKDVYVPTRAEVSRAPTMNLSRVPETLKQKSVKKKVKLPSMKEVVKDLYKISNGKSNDDLKLPTELKNYLQKVKQKQKNLNFIYKRMNKTKQFDLNEFERVRSENGMDNRSAPTQQFLSDMESFVDDMEINREVVNVSRKCAAVLKEQFPRKKNQ